MLIVLPLSVILFSYRVFVILFLKLSITSFLNALFLSLFFPGFNLLCFIGLGLLHLYWFVMFVLVLILVSFPTFQEFSFTFQMFSLARLK